MAHTDIILGIDPGSRFAGYGLIQAKGNHCTHIENGTLYLIDEDNYPNRLLKLHQEVAALISRFQVTHVAVENIFYHKNVKSTQKLGEVRGVVLLTAAQYKLTLSEFSPREVKMAITGYGAASKQQMTQMVRKLLNLRDPAEENASDALALAMCAAHHHQSNKTLATVALKSKRTKSTTSTTTQQLLAKASFYR